MFEAGAICGFVMFIALGALIGAVFLRAAIALYNKLAGGPQSASSVPEPAFGKAIGINLVAMLIDVALGFLIRLIAGPGTMSADPDSQGFNLGAQLISLPVSLLVTAALLSAMLPTSFGRAILVTLCEILILAVFIGVLAGVGMVLFAGFSR
jgi:hypothetical protein